MGIAVDRGGSRVGLQLALIVTLLWVGFAEGKGTPKNIKEIFIGRCEEYQRVIHPELFTDGWKNCTDIWVKFYKAFAYKDPCNVTVDSYSDFIEAAYHNIDTENKVMYWSGKVYPMVVNYARLKSNSYVTIQGILPAYAIRNIEDWCGQLADPGTNHMACPSWGHCPLLPATSFWTALSKNFANQVRGTVHLMLNGSSGQAYLNTSIFARSELKNLEVARTPTIHVHLAYSLKGPIKERCGQGTLVQLQQDVEKKGMKYKCTDDDLDLLYYQCVTEMEAEKCKGRIGAALGARNSALPSHASGLMQLMFLPTAAVVVVELLSLTVVGRRFF